MGTQSLPIFIYLSLFQASSGKIFPDTQYDDHIEINNIFDGPFTNNTDEILKEMKNIGATLKHKMIETGTPPDITFLSSDWFRQDWDLTEHNATFEDARKYNEITKEANKLLKKHRRSNMIGAPNERENSAWSQAEKSYRLQMIAQTWLIQARLRVYRCSYMRKFALNDKRYILGWLFSRLKTLRYDQKKLLSDMMRLTSRMQTSNLKLLLAAYYQVVKIDVDMKQVVELMKAQFARDDPYYSRIVPKSKPKDTIP